MHRPTHLLLLTLLLSFRAPAAEPVWEPAKTWIFAVGVLQFDNKSLTTWPDKDRVDAKLLEVCRKRGVPEGQIVFIKNEEATLRNVREKFVEFLQKTPADSTLFFYYAGHGSRDYNDPERPVKFMTYDSEKSWNVQAIINAIEKNFNGSRALLTADCCHSGALADAAEGKDGYTSFGVLTSAQASATSTGNWTFTQTLSDAFRGDPVMDLNADGKITFAELAATAEVVMAFCEGQRSRDEVTGKFTRDLVLAETVGTRRPREGELCEAKYEDKWWKARIIDSTPDQIRIRWVQDDGTTPWLSPNMVRKYEPRSLAAGAPVEIHWGKEWFPGEVIRCELGLVQVHYNGYPKADDEWVPFNRLKVK